VLFVVMVEVVLVVVVVVVLLVSVETSVASLLSRFHNRDNHSTRCVHKMVTAVSAKPCRRHLSQFKTARLGRSAADVIWSAVSSGTCDDVVSSSMRASVRSARKAQLQSPCCIFFGPLDYRGDIHLLCRNSCKPGLQNAGTSELGVF
jgi:hypothetical protein